MIKRDGERQRFDRAKLRAALLGAAHKRPVIASDIEAIVDRVELAAAGPRRRALLGAGRRALSRRSFASWTGAPICSSPERCRPIVGPDAAPKRGYGGSVPSAPRARMRSPAQMPLRGGT